MPKLTYPYFASAEDVDVAAIAAAAREHDRQWEEWDRQRRASCRSTISNQQSTISNHRTDGDGETQATAQAIADC